MQFLHHLNILTHVLLGTAALFLGCMALANQHRPGKHRRYGRYFLYLLTGVVVTALLGALLFRAMPFLLMLTFLSGYVGYAGYRSIRLRTRPLQGIDFGVALVVSLAAGIFVFGVGTKEASWSPAVVYPTLSALWLVTGYDMAKYLWLHQRLRDWWLYEHIYKMISAFSALLSAFSGTALPHFKPYSQILPSVICILLIGYFIRQRYRMRSCRKATGRAVAS